MGRKVAGGGVRVADRNEIQGMMGDRRVGRASLSHAHLQVAPADDVATSGSAGRELGVAPVAGRLHAPDEAQTVSPRRPSLLVTRSQDVGTVAVAVGLWGTNIRPVSRF